MTSGIFKRIVSISTPRGSGPSSSAARLPNRQRKQAQNPPPDDPNPPARVPAALFGTLRGSTLVGGTLGDMRTPHNRRVRMLTCASARLNRFVESVYRAEKDARPESVSGSIRLVLGNRCGRRHPCHAH